MWRHCTIDLTRSGFCLHESGSDGGRQVQGAEHIPAQINGTELRGIINSYSVEIPGLPEDAVPSIHAHKHTHEQIRTSSKTTDVFSGESSTSHF